MQANVFLWPLNTRGGLKKHLRSNVSIFLEGLVEIIIKAVTILYLLKCKTRFFP